MNSCMLLGNIGSGKTTWTKVLASHGYAIAYEDLAQVQHLTEYWQSNTFPFHTQIGFYAMWLSLFNEVEKKGGGFIDSSILSHHYIFTKYMYDNGIITSKEYALCDLLYHAILSSINWQCLFIYCDIDENIRRAKERSRLDENRSPDFMKELHQRYNNLFDAYNTKIVKLDVTHLSPEKEDDFTLFHRAIIEGGIYLDSCTGGN